MEMEGRRARTCLSQLEAISSKVIHLMIRDRPPDPSRMLLVCIWQRFSELACVRVELLKEGDAEVARKRRATSARDHWILTDGAASRTFFSIASSVVVGS